MANYFPEETLAEIKNAADIVEVVSEEVALKKAGRNFVGLCPFHSEKTPSFSVSPDKQIFYCFGCGTGGNVFSFLMKQHGLAFPEAVKALAARYGIQLPVESLSVEQKRRLNDRENLLAANRLAMEYFETALRELSEGKKARSYFQKRGITTSVIGRFHLGYAPMEWEGLYRLLARKRIPPETAAKAGLIIPRNNRSGFFDRFRSRIMFPIFDAGGQVIAFGGRVMDDSLPKYMNSPESPVYSKGRSLYGLNFARNRCRQSGTVYIVEGYFDLLALWQHGIENTVATLGTALTPEHVRMLKGVVGAEGKIVLVYDSDEAGLKAARRSIEIFDKGYVDAQILVLPSGHDPDSFVFQSGAEGFIAAAGRARGILSFLIESAVAKHGLSIDGKIRIVAELQEPLAAIEDVVDRSLCVKELAERIGIDEAAILEKISDASRRRPRAAPQPSEPGPALKNRLEMRMLAMMLQFPSIIPEIRRRDIVGKFGDKVLQSIGQALLARSSDSTTGAAELISLMAEKDEKSIVASLAMDNTVWDTEGAMKLIAQFEKSRNRRKQSLLERIKAAEAANDTELLNRLLKEKQVSIKKC